MNIALFGGAFDPPHLGHQHIAASILEQQIVDEVWYVPVGVHTFKGFAPKHMASAEHRLAMLKLVIDDPRVKIETYELSKTGPSYTYATLTHLAAAHPQHHFSWIIGSDNLAGFQKWLDVHPRLLDFPFYVYPRAGFAMEPLRAGMTALTNVREVEASSTEVRRLAQSRHSISDLADPRIEQYIQEHHLYAT